MLLVLNFEIDTLYFFLIDKLHFFLFHCFTGIKFPGRLIKTYVLNDNMVNFYSKQQHESQFMIGLFFKKGSYFIIPCIKIYMAPLNKILQNAPKTPHEKILNNSLKIEEDMRKWAPGKMIWKTGFSIVIIIVIPRTLVQSLMKKYGTVMKY